LRQEFRELELLDEITKLRYLGQVPPTVVGITRNELIYSFRKWKGEKYMPAAVHSAIQWSPQDPFPLQDKSKDSPWTLIDTKGNKKEIEPVKISQKDATGFVAARGTQALQSLSNTGITRKDKRKRDDDIEAEVSQSKPVKRIKASQPPAGSKSFRGFPWDPINWSCAYDSLLTILLSVYMECQPVW
ncbi:hypothetical protein OH76DRAFT_1297765, partial [Lentinus brumalis]